MIIELIISLVFLVGPMTDDWETAINVPVMDMAGDPDA